MKRKFFILPFFLLQAGIFLTSCEEKIVENIPEVVSITATPESLVYGDKITVVTTLKDDAVPLYMAKITFSVAGQAVKTDTISLSKKEETITDEFDMHLYRNAPDNEKVTVSVEVTNSEGGVDSMSINTITVNRPVFNKLYLKLENNDVLEMTQRITNPNEYECSWVVSNDVNVQIISDAITPANGTVWGKVNGSLDISTETEAAYFQLVDPLMLPSKIVFNVLTFDLGFEGTTISDGKMWIGMAQLNEETGINPEVYPDLKVMTGSGHFTKNGQVYFRGFAAEVDIDKILNPDFFEKKDGKYYFIQESGDYTIRYDTYVGFLYVYRVDGNYPNGIFIAGWGFGPPVAPYSTARSDYNFDDETLPPGVFYFMPKIADGAYAATVYLAVDATGFCGFNFYYQKGWGDPTGSGPDSAAEVTGSVLAYSTNDAFPLNNGAVWREGIATPFTNGIYSLKVDFNKRELSATLITAVN